MRGVTVASGPQPIVPELEGDALAAARYRGGHLQIIASAGAGKTEVVAQRVARLISEGAEPSSIVAFTFTERAAASLKSRIDRRAVARCGEEVLDRIGSMFVGTIHSYCLRLLQQFVPRFEVYDVLDDHRLTAFLSREAYRLGVSDLDSRLYDAIANFASTVQVVENELIALERLRPPFQGVYARYCQALHDARLLTYGQFIVHAVHALGEARVRAAVHDSLRHLVVDEYQDINPAQEALIQRMAAGGAHLCVVGDDQQSIFQWRGSTVANIVTFSARYSGVATFRIETNRRSRPAIVAAANSFAESIQERIAKRMAPRRPAARNEVVCWQAETRSDEALLIAQAIRRAHDIHGYRYRDIAVLCRLKASFPPLLDAFANEGVPVQPGGRTALFDQPEADLFGRTICWLVGYDWRTSRYAWQTEPVTDQALLDGYRAVYDLTADQLDAVRTHLGGWRRSVEDESGPANLVRDFYELLAALRVEDWPLEDPLVINRLGTLARCSQILADYEAASRRSRPDPHAPGEQRGARDRGRRHYEWLARYVQNWARGAYEAFEGEEDVGLDAVDLLTVHKAKGLEWPVVFVPQLTEGRFPSGRAGDQRPWLIPRGLFDAARYEGSDDDERRLFYVAVTRARDHLSLSAFARIKQAATPSPYLLEVLDGSPMGCAPSQPPPAEPRSPDDDVSLEISFSDLAAFSECGLAFRLRRQIGFQPNLVPEIGYGRAVHHIMRQLAEMVRTNGEIPSAASIDDLFNRAFFLPAANRPAHRQLKAKARELVGRYIAVWGEDLQHVWAVERPFSLHFGDAIISGRADVILDDSEGDARLAIVDYKTAADDHDRHAFQLRVYTDAGRREGLTVDRAFVHDLRGAARRTVPIGSEDVEIARRDAVRLLAMLRQGAFSPQPGEPCRRCDVRLLCRHRLTGVGA